MLNQFYFVYENGEGPASPKMVFLNSFHHKTSYLQDFNLYFPLQIKNEYQFKFLPFLVPNDMNSLYLNIFREIYKIKLLPKTDLRGTKIVVSQGKKFSVPLFEKIVVETKKPQSGSISKRTKLTDKEKQNKIKEQNKKFYLSNKEIKKEKENLRYKKKKENEKLD